MYLRAHLRFVYHNFQATKTGKIKLNLIEQAPHLTPSLQKAQV
jgi:hypothetical protein